MAYNCPHCTKEITDALPKERIAEINQNRREAENRAAELEAQLKDAQKKAATADALTAQLTEVNSRYESDRLGWASERAIVSVGVTDQEGVDVIRALYDRVQPDAKGNKPTIGDWLGNRDALPKAVRTYLPEAAAPAAAEPAPGQGAGGQPAVPAAGGTPRPAPAGAGNVPPANAGARPFTAAPAQFSPQSIAQMPREEFAAALPNILGQLGGAAGR